MAFEAAGNSFTGEYPYTLDDRNRVPIPPSYRAKFNDGVMITPGFEPCITVYTLEGFDTAMQAIRSLPDLVPYVRSAKRSVFGKARELPKPDGQGRIVLEPTMMEKAHIAPNGPVFVIGRDDVLEIWDRQTYLDLEQERDDAHALALAELGKLYSARLGIAVPE